MVKRTVVLCLALAAAVAWAGPEIRANALFPGKAMLSIDGQSRLLKAGETSPEGVRLVSSTSREALVEVDGERRRLVLSRHIGARFREADVAQVRIPRDADSHYRVRGAINGRGVAMMVDTGATSVAMNVHEARRLGVRYRNGRPAQAVTAGGVVEGFQVSLDKVVIGNITVREVPAVVLMGEFPEQVLLGNSLLGRLEMRQEAGVLVLQQKY